MQRHPDAPIQNEIDRYFTREDRSDPGWQKLTSDEQRLFIDLHHKQSTEQSKLETTVAEKIQKSLFLTLISTIGGFLVATLRDLTQLFSAIIGGLIGLVSGLGGFVIQGILTIWELIGLGTAQYQNKKIEQGKTRAVIGITHLGLITVGCLTLMGIISFASVLAPFMIPAIFLTMIGLNYYKEKYIAQEAQREKGKVQTELTTIEEDLNKYFDHIVMQDPIQNLQLEIHQHQINLINARFFEGTNHTKENLDKLTKEIHNKNRQIQKILFNDTKIKEFILKIASAQTRIEELNIKEKYATKKKHTLRYCVLGVLCLLAGAGLTLVSGPLGLVVSLVGLSILGKQFNQLRLHSGKEATALKKCKVKKETPLIERMHQINRLYHPFEYRPVVAPGIMVAQDTHATYATKRNSLPYTTASNDGVANTNTRIAKSPK